MPPVYAYNKVLLSGAALGPFGLAVAGGFAPAGMYRVSFIIITNVAGAGNIQFFVGWGDVVGGKAAQTNMNFTVNNYIQGTVVLYTNGLQHITWQTIYAGPGTYSVTITLERLSLP